MYGALYSIKSIWFLSKESNGLPEDGVTITETRRRLSGDKYMYLTYYVDLIGKKRCKAPCRGPRPAELYIIEYLDYLDFSLQYHHDARQNIWK